MVGQLLANLLEVLLYRNPPIEGTCQLNKKTAYMITVRLSGFRYPISSWLTNHAACLGVFENYNV